MTDQHKPPFNGGWAIYAKILLVAALPWASFITVGQILDNEFRGQGERFTKEMAEQQTRFIVLESTKAMIDILRDHEDEPGHQMMLQRVKALERIFDATHAVEHEETEILRDMEKSISQYVESMMKRQ